MENGGKEKDEEADFKPRVLTYGKEEDRSQGYMTQCDGCWVRTHACP